MPGATTDLRPMKAVTGPLPKDDGRWAYEIKWDGMRLLAHIADGSLRVVSGNGIDATARFPELEGLAGAIEPVSAVLDGEAIALDDRGRPNFGRLQHRMHIADPFEARRRATEVPVALALFDVLRIDGHDVCDLPYLERRRLLRELVPDGAAWRVPEHRLEDGQGLLDAVAQQGLEGVVAKRVDSPYLPGRRSPLWVKVKARLRQEFVIGGWWPGEKGRAGRIGSLIIGVHDGVDGPLRFAGKVGTGFTEAELDRLAGLLGPLATEECPFDPPPPRAIARHAHWVRPGLVAEVEFGEWTADSVLRHPSYLGLRIDKPPTEVVREGEVDG